MERPREPQNEDVRPGWRLPEYFHSWIEKNVGAELERAHSHYFKPSPYDHVDVYRVLEMFEVTDPCIQHAAKKLLVAGGRGHKDITKDIQDAIDTLLRWQEMRREEQA